MSQPKRLNYKSLCTTCETYLSNQTNKQSDKKFKDHSKNWMSKCKNEVTESRETLDEKYIKPRWNGQKRQ